LAGCGGPLGSRLLLSQISRQPCSTTNGAGVRDWSVGRLLLTPRIADSEARDSACWWWLVLVLVLVADCHSSIYRNARNHTVGSSHPASIKVLAFKIGYYLLGPWLTHCCTLRDRSLHVCLRACVSCFLLRSPWC
jgi:hypothetical protein